MHTKSAISSSSEHSQARIRCPGSDTSWLGVPGHGVGVRGVRRSNPGGNAQFPSPISWTRVRTPPKINFGQLFKFFSFVVIIFHRHFGFWFFEGFWQIAPLCWHLLQQGEQCLCYPVLDSMQFGWDWHFVFPFSLLQTGDFGRMLLLCKNRRNSFTIHPLLGKIN